MARPFAKSLEEQLTVAQEELKKTEEKVATLKQKIVDLNHAIRERDKENIFAAIETSGLSIDVVLALLERQSENTEEAVKNTKNKKSA